MCELQTWPEAEALYLTPFVPITQGEEVSQPHPLYSGSESNVRPKAAAATSARVVLHE
jgi:hypothetical protein